MTQTQPQPTLVLDDPPNAVLTAVLRAPFEARTWKQLLYVVAAFVLGCAGVCYLFFGIGGGLYLSVFLVGIPLLALLVLGRYPSCAVPGPAGYPVEAPPAFHRERGFFGFLRSAFTDRASWRALLFLFVQAVVGIAAGYLGLMVVAMTVFIAVSPIPWLLFHPMNIDPEGVERHSLDGYAIGWSRVCCLDTVVGMSGTDFDDLEFARRQLHLAVEELADTEMTPQDRVQLGLLAAQVALSDRLSALLSDDPITSRLRIVGMEPLPQQRVTSVGNSSALEDN